MDFPVGTYKIILLPHLFQKIGWDILFPLLFYPSFSPLTYVLLSCMFKNLVTKECKFFSNCVVPENIHTLPKEGHWRGSLEILRRGGGGGLLPNILKESMKLNWNFQRGVGVQTKNPLWGEYGKFLEQHNIYIFFQLVTFKLELKVNRWSDLNKRNKNSGQLLKLD